MHTATAMTSLLLGNDRDMVCTNHLEKLRGRNTEKKGTLFPFHRTHWLHYPWKRRCQHWVLWSLTASTREHEAADAVQLLSSPSLGRDHCRLVPPPPVSLVRAPLPRVWRVCALSHHRAGNVAPARARPASQHGLQPVPRRVCSLPTGACYSGGASFVGSRRTAAPPVRAAVPPARRPPGMTS